MIHKLQLCIKQYSQVFSASKFMYIMSIIFIFNVVSNLTLGVIDMAQHVLMFRGSNHSSHQYLTLSITLCNQSESFALDMVL